MDPKEYLKKIEEASNFIKSKIGDREVKVGVVLGSGLGRLGDSIANSISIPYSEIPHFALSTAIGHKGVLIVGELGGKTVMAMQGRFHYYEGWGMEQVTLPIRVMRSIGISTLIVSNAAGGVNPQYRVGDLMVIEDHINLMPNPLVGKNLDDFGPRFPDMTRPYDKKLIAKALDIAAKLDIELHQGVYLASTGPTYETPAEYRFFRTIGADAVGMSTVPEVIVARHSSIPTFGVSVITNEGFNFSESFVNDGDDVVKAANQASKKLEKIVTELIASL
ncbi:MAG: purine-nucleoside phosphorylase [Bacteroidales bacterium]